MASSPRRLVGTMLAAALLGCEERTRDPQVAALPVEPKPPETGDEVQLIGCVAATGQPGQFLLTVSEHDPERTRGEAAGSVVPRSGASPLPPSTGGSSTPAHLPRPGPPPEGETTAWTLTTRTYRLFGSGGLRLSEHLGHTIEVSGTLTDTATGQTIEDLAARRTPDPGAPADNGSIDVRSARHVSDICAPYSRR